MRTERLAPSVATSKHRQRLRGHFLSQRGEELSKSQHAGAVFSQTCSTLPKTKALTARSAGRNLGALLPPFQPPRQTQLCHEELLAWRSSGCWSRGFSRAGRRPVLLCCPPRGSVSPPGSFSCPLLGGLSALLPPAPSFSAPSAASESSAAQVQPVSIRFHTG